MDIGILHLHKTVIWLFLLFFGFKVILLLIGNYALLDKVREKTKVVEMVFGTLILLTGGYLSFRGGHPETWLMAKVALVLAFIPLSIISLKKHNKALALIALLGFFYVYGVTETRSLSLSKPDYTAAGQDATAAIYKAECARCHGEDGAAGKFGALNLQQSTLSAAEIKNVISNGRGTMPAFKDKLSEEQIAGLADYVEGLKTK